MPTSPRQRSARHLALALVGALLLMVGGAGPAAAAPATITKVFGGPITTGANPFDRCKPDGTANKTDASSFTDFCVAFSAANPDGPEGVDLKRQVVDTPQGFAGVADAFPQCSDADFFNATAQPNANAACNPNTQMGEVQAKIRAQISQAASTNIAVVLGLGSALNGRVVSLTPDGAVFNLQHSENEVARLGIELRPAASFLNIQQPRVKIIVRVTLRPAPDVGLRSIIDDMPQTAAVSFGGLSPDEPADPLAVDEFSLLFWGPSGTRPSMQGKSFGFLGANCENTQETKIAATAYDGSGTGGASPTYKLTNCDSPNIPFKPGYAVTTSERRADVTTATTVSVKFGGKDNENYQTSGPKKTVVVLPTGLSFSGQIASGANGLPLCTPDQFGQTRAEPSACPAATAVGTVSFESPVQSRKLTGLVYLGAQPAAGELPDIYIEAQLGPAADAPRVKLIGHLTVDDQNRIVTTLDDLPEVPVTEFLLTFRGGDQAAVVTPPTCATTQGYLAATPYSTRAVQNRDTSYTVDQDCDAVTAFAPSLSFEGANPNAGQTGTFTTTVSRPDRTQRLSKAVVNLPPGEVANLKGVPECSQEAAAASACPANTQVGTISSLAGVGPAPYRADGQIYLTNRSSGAVAGVSLHVPVKFGDVYLGDLNVPARIEIRDNDLGLRFVADVPERFKGIPLNIRELKVSLDRKDFSLNPTSCAKLTTTSTFTASAGATANTDASYQVANCDKLKFAPKFDAAITGQTANKGRPTVQVRIENAAGSGNMRATTVTLPKGVGVDLVQIPRACPQDTFAAGACPDVAKIGKISGSLSIADEPLTGDMYLLKPPAGKVLPGVGLSFTGRFAGRVAGNTAVDPKTGQLVTDFPGVPDLPLTALQIDITGGNGGPVIATEDLCKSDDVVFSGKFAAHSGQSTTGTVKTRCGAPLSSVGSKVTGRLSGVRKGKPLLTFGATPPTGQKITKLELTIPNGWTLGSQKGKTGTKYARVSKLTVKKKATIKRLTSRRVRVTIPSGGTSTFKLLTRSGTMTIKSASARKTKSKVSFTAKITLSNGSTQTVPFKLTPR